MAPVIKPATSSSIDFSDLSTLRCKTEDGMDASFAFENLSQGEEDDDDDDIEDGLALKRTTKKTGDQPVSKRTLQNRKAQREFRKRREARVRELEERCRRFDQMGLEANSELQRAARGLKEENDSLRGFIMRIGFGHMIPNLLSDINSHRSFGNDQMNQSQQQATFSGGMFDNSTNSFGNQPTFFIDTSPTSNSNFNSNRSRSMTTGNDFRPSLQNQIDVEKMASGITLPSPLQYSQMTLAPTPTPLSSQQQRNKTQRRSSSKAGSSSSPGSSRSNDNNPEAPLLSLSLNQKQAQQQADQSQAEFGQPQLSAKQSKPWETSNSNSMFAGSANNGIGNGGTAMLQNINGGANFAPFPVVSQRNRQNAALLNPNPIPFAFNLSAGDLANQQPTWWEQMGGGTEQIELDDKAQAVANAQAGAQQAPSPFDLSAFLQGGITPGGGFQLAQVGSSQGGSQSIPLAVSSKEMAKTGSTDTDHMRMFIKLMERKMAERDAHTYASLGFQPPSQDPAQRNKQQKQESKSESPSNFGSHMTPSGVYSRLAQHPAFLSTNAREMEELVDALGPSTWKNENGGGNEHSKEGGEDGKSDLKDDYSFDNNKNSSNNKKRSHSQSSSNKSPSQTSLNGSPGKVHVDEIAIGKLLGLLDQKRISNDFKGFGNNHDETQRFSMAMT